MTAQICLTLGLTDGCWQFKIFNQRQYGTSSLFSIYTCFHYVIINFSLKMPLPQWRKGAFWPAILPPKTKHHTIFLSFISDSFFSQNFFFFFFFFFFFLFFVYSFSISCPCYCPQFVILNFSPFFIEIDIFLFCYTLWSNQSFSSVRIYNLQD